MTSPSAVGSTGSLAGLSDLTDFSGMTSTAVYLVLFALVFVESGLLVGFFLPGDSVLFAVGLLAASGADGDGPALSLPVLCVGVFVAAVAGDAVGYWSGRRLGRPWLLRRAGRAASQVERTEQFYRRFGPGAVVIARFIPWVRTFTPIVAGVARMPYLRFAAANAAGAAVWGVGLVLLGWFAADLPWLKWAAYAVAGAAILASVAAGGVAVVRGRRAAQPVGPAPHASTAQAAQSPQAGGTAQEARRP